LARLHDGDVLPSRSQFLAIGLAVVPVAVQADLLELHLQEMVLAILAQVLKTVETPTLITPQAREPRPESL
jgi:hypothetical protein